ncbi:MAG: HAD hydrolase family protein, partial [Candidatus Omnitrophota bacterium]
LGEGKAAIVFVEFALGKGLSYSARSVRDAVRFINGALEHVNSRAGGFEAKTYSGYSFFEDFHRIDYYAHGIQFPEGALGEVARILDGYKPGKDGGDERALSVKDIEELRKPFKMIITDVDDSIIPAGRVLEPETKQLLEELISFNVKVVPVSGRLLRGRPSSEGIRETRGVMDLYARRMSPKSRAGQYLYTEGGGRGFKFDEQGELIEEPVFYEPLFMLSDPLREKNINMLNGVISSAVIEVSRAKGYDPGEFLPVNRRPPENPVSMNISGRLSRVPREVRQQIALAVQDGILKNPPLYGIKAAATSLAVEVVRATKADAFWHCLSVSGISPEDVLVIGDSDNDIAMLDASRQATKLFVGPAPYQGKAKDVIVTPVRNAAGARSALRLVLDAYMEQYLSEQNIIGKDGGFDSPVPDSKSSREAALARGDMFKDEYLMEPGEVPAVFHECLNELYRRGSDPDLLIFLATEALPLIKVARILYMYAYPWKKTPVIISPEVHYGVNNQKAVDNISADLKKAGLNIKNINSAIIDGTSDSGKTLELSRRLMISLGAGPLRVITCALIQNTRWMVCEPDIVGKRVWGTWICTSWYRSISSDIVRCNLEDELEEAARSYIRSRVSRLDARGVTDGGVARESVLKRLFNRPYAPAEGVLALQRMIAEAMKNAPGRAVLLMVDGPSGVGKTSFVRQIERRGDAVIAVHRDDYLDVRYGKSGRIYSSIDWRGLALRVQGVARLKTARLVICEGYRVSEIGGYFDLKALIIAGQGTRRDNLAADKSFLSKMSCDYRRPGFYYDLIIDNSGAHRLPPSLKIDLLAGADARDGGRIEKYESNGVRVFLDGMANAGGKFDDRDRIGDIRKAADELFAAGDGMEFLRDITRLRMEKYLSGTFSGDAIMRGYWVSLHPQSFRRFIINDLNVEVKIPGEKHTHSYVSPEDFDMIFKIPGIPFQRPLMKIVLPAGEYDLYGEKRRMEAFVVVIAEHYNSSRLDDLTSNDVDTLVYKTGLTRQQIFVLLACGPSLIIKALHKKGYSISVDQHYGNFGVVLGDSRTLTGDFPGLARSGRIPPGTVMMVNDCATMGKMLPFARDYRRGEELRTVIDRELSLVSALVMVQYSGFKSFAAAALEAAGLVLGAYWVVGILTAFEQAAVRISCIGLAAAAALVLYSALLLARSLTSLYPRRSYRLRERIVLFVASWVAASLLVGLPLGFLSAIPIFLLFWYQQAQKARAEWVKQPAANFASFKTLSGILEQTGCPKESIPGLVDLAFNVYKSDIDIPFGEPAAMVEKISEEFKLYEKRDGGEEEDYIRRLVPRFGCDEVLAVRLIKGFLPVSFDDLRTYIVEVTYGSKILTLVLKEANTYSYE